MQEIKNSGRLITAPGFYFLLFLHWMFKIVCIWFYLQSMEKSLDKTLKKV